MLWACLLVVLVAVAAILPPPEGAVDALVGRPLSMPRFHPGTVLFVSPLLGEVMADVDSLTEFVKVELLDQSYFLPSRLAASFR